MLRPMAGQIDPAFSDLLARLYAGIGEAQPWRRFLEALAGWMDASFATLIITAPGKRQPATFLTPGSSPAFDAAYTETLFANDPFRGLPDGVVTSYAEFMAGLPETDFAEYRAAMAQSGFDEVLGMDLNFGSAFADTHGAARQAEGRWEARFRVSRHNSLAPFTRGERARFQALAPHLRIAVGLFEKLQFAGAEHGVFHATAQGLGLALVVLDRAGRIVSTNALAESLLAEDEGLRRRGEELVFAEPAHQRLLADLMGGRRGVGGPGGLCRFRIARPERGDLVATARPLDLSAIHDGAGALALFLARPVAEAHTDALALRDLLGLTAAEARLAAVLAEGHSLVEAARRMGIAHNTAKVQLRSVFAKTGVHRQAQLVALIASLGG